MIIDTKFTFPNLLILPCSFIISVLFLQELLVVLNFSSFQTSQSHCIPKCLVPCLPRGKVYVLSFSAACSLSCIFWGLLTWSLSPQHQSCQSLDRNHMYFVRWEICKRETNHEHMVNFCNSGYFEMGLFFLLCVVTVTFCNNTVQFSVSFLNKHYPKCL